MDTDFLLIRKMKRGDERAFDLFVRRHYEEILKYCSYHCPDSSYAEDLTQEVFVRFFAGLSGYRHMGKTLNYLYTIAGNLCRDYYRKTKEAFLEEYAAEMESGELQGSVGQSETARLILKITVEEALKRLPDELREVIILYYFQELKLTEIADTLHIGLPLVKYRIRQAKAQLKKMLGEE